MDDPSELATEMLPGPPGPAWQLKQMELGSALRRSQGEGDDLPPGTAWTAWQPSQGPTPPSWKGYVVTPETRKRRMAAMQRVRFHTTWDFTKKFLKIKQG